MGTEERFSSSQALCSEAFGLGSQAFEQYLALIGAWRWQRRPMEILMGYRRMGSGPVEISLKLLPPNAAGFLLLCMVLLDWN